MSTLAISPQAPKWPSWLALSLRILVALAVTFLFLTSVNIVGASFNMANKDFTHDLIKYAGNPLIGVLVGLLVTSLVQSSSATTSMLVALVATGDLPVAAAIPVVMGANIGTTVTNTLVAMGHVTRPAEFRRAICCSTMHDFFNMLSVIILLPLEYSTHFLEQSATWLASHFGDLTKFNAPKSPLKTALKVLPKFLEENLGRLPDYWGAITMAVIGVALIFLALWLLTRMLKALMLGKVENVLGTYLDRHGPVGILIGAGATAAVQSSSVTTSFFVPLAAAGVLKPRQIYPMLLGANIGTTITALLAAIGAGEVAGLTLAFAHLLFNVCGILIFYPFPRLRLPIFLAARFARIAARRRILALTYIFVAFYGVPILLIFATRFFR